MVNTPLNSKSCLKLKKNHRKWLAKTTVVDGKSYFMVNNPIQYVPIQQGCHINLTGFTISPRSPLLPQQHLTVRLVFKFDLFRQGLSLRAGRAQRLRGTAVSYTHIYIYYMGVSENSVPLNPMVNDHDPY